MIICRDTFLPVPGPIATQRHLRVLLNTVDEPQRACRSHDQTQRVRPNDALPFATLILAQPMPEASRETPSHPGLLSQWGDQDILGVYQSGTADGAGLAGLQRDPATGPSVPARA